jgi:hypothetical protein
VWQTKTAKLSQPRISTSKTKAAFNHSNLGYW